MILYQGKIYLAEEHIEQLKSEAEYVKDRYHAIAKTLAPDPFRITRKKAADLLELCKRQFQRWIARFRCEGILGLRNRSRRPKTSPRRVPKEIEDDVVKVRDKTGFGPNDIANLLNISYQRGKKQFLLWASTAYNILVRKGIIERDKRIEKEWKRFEWGHPNRLIQADLTHFNGVPVLTMECDHSRRGWSIGLRDMKDKTVVKAMKQLVNYKYDNLLTDNGSQFSRKNAEMRKYCEEYLNEKHIWSSIHHPQTLGKLSAFQKGLKRFLRHMVGRSQDFNEINYWIEVYMMYYNNGKYHRAIKTYPMMRYSGKRDETWYESLVKALKLEDVLVV
jgi:transposase InsO family protein